MPTLDVKLYVRGLWFDTEGEQDKRIRQPPGRDEWITLHADQVTTISLYIFFLIVNVVRRIHLIIFCCSLT